MQHTGMDTARKTGQAHAPERLWAAIEAIGEEMELRPLLAGMLRQACALIQADCGTIGLVDSDRGVVRIEAACGLPADIVGVEIPLEGSAGRRAPDARKPAIYPRQGDLEDVSLPDLRDHAAIHVPLSRHGHHLGRLCLYAAPPRQFTPEEADVLAQFAAHSAIALRNAHRYEKALCGLNELRLLYETSRRISTAMEIDEVIAAYLEQIAAGGRYSCSVALYERDEAGERTAIVVHHRWSPERGMVRVEDRYPFPARALDPEGQVLSMLDAGQTVTIADVQTDPRISPALREFQMRTGRPALAIVPLMVRGQSIGLVLMSYPTAHAWQENELQPYQATAAQLATAIDSRQQNRLLHERSRHIALLEERQRLARELHDSVTQLVFSITLIAQSVGDAWRRSPDEGERQVERLLDLSQWALREMRALLAELRPSPAAPVIEPPAEPSAIERVRQEGLVDALRRHINDIAGDGPEFLLNTSLYLRQPAETEEALFRIAQEALNNALKHAQAQCITICLCVDAGMAELAVADDGVGFHPEAAAQPGSLGLITMRERAEALGGSLSLASAPGGGTTVEARIPSAKVGQK